MIPPLLARFIKELLNRMRSKSPRFFFVMQIISGSLVFAGYLPSALQIIFNIDISHGLIWACERVGAWSVGLWTGSILTVNGSTQNDPDKLPFTHK